MRRAGQSIVIAFVVGLILSLSQPSTQAATTQNLSWGVSVGDQFTYHFMYKDYQYPIYDKSFDIIVNVTGLFDIPENISSINSLYYFPIYANVTLYYENMTEVGMISYHLPNLIWPVGNWSLWSNLAYDYLSGYYSTLDVTNEETLSTWSFKINGRLSDMYNEETYIFNKTTGVLNYLEYISYWENSPVFSYSLERFPITTPPPLNGMLLLVVGAGTVILVITVVMIRKFK